MTNRIESYITQFTQLFDGEPWLDESFSKKLDPLSDAQAFAPSPGNNHSVAEVVSHLVEWRKEVMRRLKDNSAERRLTEEIGQLETFAGFAAGRMAATVCRAATIAASAYYPAKRC